VEFRCLPCALVTIWSSSAWAYKKAVAFERAAVPSKLGLGEQSRAISSLPTGVSQLRTRIIRMFTGAAVSFLKTLSVARCEPR